MYILLILQLALGVLIPAAIALSLIGQVEEYSESPFIVRFLGRDTEVNFETFDADGSWRAAGCSLFASILAIISQFAMYATCGLTCAKHYYHYYKLICSITVSSYIVCMNVHTICSHVYYLYIVRIIVIMVWLEGNLMHAQMHVQECLGGDASSLKIVCRHLHASPTLTLILHDILISKYSVVKAMWQT